MGIRAKLEVLQGKHCGAWILPKSLTSRDQAIAPRGIMAQPQELYIRIPLLPGYAVDPLSMGIRSKLEELRAIDNCQCSILVQNTRNITLGCSAAETL